MLTPPMSTDLGFEPRGLSLEALVLAIEQRIQEPQIPFI